jgi:DNA-binding IclR family transcriptional regulator
MPVFGIGDSLVGALAISGPVSRLTTARAEQIKDALVEAASKLTAACGGTSSSDTPKRARKRSSAAV